MFLNINLFINFDFSRVYECLDENKKPAALKIASIQNVENSEREVEFFRSIEGFIVNNRLF